MVQTIVTILGADFVKTLLVELFGVSYLRVKPSKQIAVKANTIKVVLVTSRIVVCQVRRNGRRTDFAWSSF